jgi:hypothetical protein
MLEPNRKIWKTKFKKKKSGNMATRKPSSPPGGLIHPQSEEHMVSKVLGIILSALRVTKPLDHHRVAQKSVCTLPNLLTPAQIHFSC